MAGPLDAVNKAIFTAEDRTGPAVSSVLGGMRAIKGSFEDVKSSMDGFRGAIDVVNRAMGILAAVGAGVTFVEFASGVVEATAKLKVLSDATGSSVESLSQISNRAKVAGTDLDTLQGFIIKMASGMDRADASTNKVAEGLKFLKVTATDPAEALDQVIEKLSEYGDGIGKIQLIRDIFKRSDAEFIATLKTMGELHGIAATRTREQAVEAEHLEQQLRLLKLESQGFADALLNVVVPALNEIIARFRDARSAGMGLYDAFVVAFQKNNLFGLSGGTDGDMDALTKRIQGINDQIDKINKSPKDNPLRAWLPGLVRDLDAANKDLNGLSAVSNGQVARQLSANGGDAYGGAYGASNKPPAPYRSDSAKAVDEVTNSLLALVKATQSAALSQQHLGEVEKVYLALQDPKLQALNDEQQKLARKAMLIAQVADFQKQANQEGLDEAAAVKRSIEYQTQLAALISANAAALGKIQSEAITNAQADVERQYQRGTLTFKEYWDGLTALQQTAIGVQESQLQQQVTAQQTALEQMIKLRNSLRPEQFKTEADYLDAVAKASGKVNEAQIKLIEKQADLNVTQQKGAEIGKDYIEVLIAQSNGLLESNKALDDQIVKQTRANEEIGLTTNQIFGLRIARVEEARANAELTGQAPDVIKFYDDQIDRLQRLRGVMVAGEDKQRITDGWKQVFTDAANAGANFIEDFARHGSSAFKNLWDNFKSWALSAFAKIAAQSLVINLAGMASPSLGTAAANTFGAQTPGALNLLSTGSSLYSGLSGLGTAATAGYAAGAAGFTTAGSAGVIEAGSIAGGVLEGGGGIAAGIAGGAEAVLAAIPVWGWAALAAIAIYSIFSGKGGGPKAGGFATSGIDIASGQATPGITMDRFFTPNQADSQLGTVTGQLGLDYFNNARALGLRAGAAQFALGYDTDPQGTAQSRVSSAVSINGQQVYYNRDQNVGRDDAALQAALQLEAKRALFAALQASDLPDYLSNIFKGVDASTADAATIDRVIQTAQALKFAVDTVKGLGDQFAKMDPTQIQGLVEAFGGLANFTQSFQFVNANFLTDAQRLTTATASLNTSFASLNIAVPQTHAEFLALLNSFDLTTDAGRQMYASVSALAPAFIAVNGTAEQAAQAVQQAAAALAQLRQSGQSVYLQNFATPDQKTQALWDQIAGAWNSGLGARILKLTNGAFDHIPTTTAGIQALRTSLSGVDGGLDLFNEVMGTVGGTIVTLNSTIGDLGTTATATVEDVKSAIVSLADLTTLETDRIKRQNDVFQSIVDQAGGDTGDKIALRLSLSASQLANAQKQVDDLQQYQYSPYSSGNYLAAVKARDQIKTTNDELIAQLAEYTTLKAQYGGAIADQLMQLEDWYTTTEQTLRTVAPEDLGKLDTVFAQKWQDIINGTKTGVDGTIAQLAKLRQGILDYANKLQLGDLSVLSPNEKLAQAQKQYNDVVSLARGNDQNALGQFSQVADALLQASRAVNASGGSYTADYTKVLTDARSLGAPASPAAATGAIAAALPTSSKLASAADIKTVVDSVLAVAARVDSLETSVTQGLARVTNNTGQTVDAVTENTAAVRRGGQTVRR